MHKSLSLASVLLLVCASVSRADPVDLDLFYTTYAGGPNVWKVHFNFDGTNTPTLSANTNIASTAGADGIVFDPTNGNLLIGGQGFDGTAPIHEITTGGVPVISKPAGSAGGAYHLSVDPRGDRVWVASIPGGLGEVGLPVTVAGTPHTITGDVSAVDTLAWPDPLDPDHAFYTSSGSGGFGAFGEIDMTTFVTTNDIAVLPAAHGMAFDPFTGDLILFGDGNITQIDPSSPGVIKSGLAVGGVNFDQGAVDGKGHIFVADNGGNLFFLDYSVSGMVGTPDYTNLQFLNFNLDDLAPLSGPGSNPGPVPEPATILLSGLGILGLLHARRRNRRS